MLWGKWMSFCGESGKAETYTVLDEASGSALTIGELNGAIGSLLSGVAGNADLYSLYASRRGMPIVSLTRGASEREGDAMGMGKVREIRICQRGAAKVDKERR